MQLTKHFCTASYICLKRQKIELLYTEFIKPIILNIMKKIMLGMILQLMRMFQIYPGEIEKAWDRKQWKKWVYGVLFSHPVLFDNGVASSRFIKNAKPIGVVLDTFVVLLDCPCKEMTNTEAFSYCSRIKAGKQKWRVATAEEIDKIQRAWQDIARIQYMLGVKHWFLPFAVETTSFAFKDICKQYANGVEKKCIIPVADYRPNTEV